MLAFTGLLLPVLLLLHTGHLPSPQPAAHTTQVVRKVVVRKVVHERTVVVREAAPQAPARYAAPAAPVTAPKAATQTPAKKTAARSRRPSPKSTAQEGHTDAEGDRDGPGRSGHPAEPGRARRSRGRRRGAGRRSGSRLAPASVVRVASWALRGQLHHRGKGVAAVGARAVGLRSGAPERHGIATGNRSYPMQSAEDDRRGSRPRTLPPLGDAVAPYAAIRQRSGLHRRPPRARSPAGGVGSRGSRSATSSR